MRALVWRGHSRIEDVPVPGVGPDDVLVRVAYAGICGSDLAIVSGEHDRARPPLIPGHELAGHIVRRGSAVPESLNVGQRVVIEPTLSCGRCRPCRSGSRHVCSSLKVIGVETNGGFAEYVSVPYHRLHAIPPQLDLLHAALVEPLAVAIHAVSRIRHLEGSTVVVAGAGPIGLLIAEVLRQDGSPRTFVASRNEYRLGLGRDLGFCMIDTRVASLADAIADLTEGEGADVCFDATGGPPNTQMQMETTAVSGTLVVVGTHKSPACLEMNQLVYGERSVIGSRVYSSEEFARALRLAADGTVRLQPLISSVVDLPRYADAFGQVASRSGSCKVVLRP